MLKNNKIKMTLLVALRSVTVVLSSLEPWIVFKCFGSNPAFCSISQNWGLLINSFSYFPNREKTAVNQPSPKNVFFFSKKYLKLGGKIHHFKAKKISFPTEYNLFTDN